MINKRMEEKIKTGEAIDISGFPKNEEGDYILEEFVEGKDYCDSKEECWIWSIGLDYETKKILASTTTKFYQNSAFKCLFLR